LRGSELYPWFRSKAAMADGSPAADCWEKGCGDGCWLLRKLVVLVVKTE